jgi:hypothetical protein
MFIGSHHCLRNSIRVNTFGVLGVWAFGRGLGVAFLGG